MRRRRSLSAASWAGTLRGARAGGKRGGWISLGQVGKVRFGMVGFRHRLFQKASVKAMEEKKLPPEALALKFVREAAGVTR